MDGSTSESSNPGQMKPPGLMERLVEQLLREAESQGRFQHQRTQYVLIESGRHPTRHRAWHLDSSALNTSPLPPPAPSGLEDDENQYHLLKLLVQQTRPQHTSGQSDKLPFANAAAVRKVFAELHLPLMYIQIADGSPAIASASILNPGRGQPTRYELVAHCITKQGDWAMALSHRADVKTTSVFWSLDQRIDSKVLLAELEMMKEYACHPMLVPCIMFSATLRDGVYRRHTIKSKLGRLEDTIRHINLKASQTSHEDFATCQALFEQPQSVESLFELLNSCRREQASREGRYDFWRSFHVAIEQGFVYAEQTLLESGGESLVEAHSELKQWTELLWRKFESVKARDIDHVCRVDNVSDMLFHLLTQRDSRIQSTIAKASQRDNEDMKFIALLGSVFLPASLVATILNVQPFQFAPGPQLFGAYIGITAPLIAVVIAIAMTRRHMMFNRRRRNANDDHTTKRTDSILLSPSSPI